MTAPIPEQHDEPLATAGMGERPREHASELPDAADGTSPAEAREAQEENAETSLDEPSDDAGEV